MDDRLDFNHLKKERVNLLDQLNRLSKSDLYKTELGISQAIQAGDKELLEDHLSQVDKNKVITYIRKHFKDHSNILQDVRFYLRCTNTFSRIAASKGGVLPHYLHINSESLITIIDNNDSLDYLLGTVLFDIFRSYCDITAQLSTNSYSPIMKEIVTYITENLTSDLTLKDIAEKHEMHPVHLARKFKQETGKTFISYVNQQRIFLAKYYFQLQKYQLSEVAYLSGFNSHSYFTKVFKKISGETPTKYIRHLHQ